MLTSLVWRLTNDEPGQVGVMTKLKRTVQYALLMKDSTGRMFAYGPKRDQYFLFSYDATHLLLYGGAHWSADRVNAAQKEIAEVNKEFSSIGEIAGLIELCNWAEFQARLERSAE